MQWMFSPFLSQKSQSNININMGNHIRNKEKYEHHMNIYQKSIINT